ncbi:UPF0488 protein CG14286 [Anthophora retusa]
MPPKSRTITKKPAMNKKNVGPSKAASSSNANPDTSSGLSQEAEDQFELELCWCIQQLEMCLATGKLSEKQVHDLTKNINTLRSNNAPLVKKRQVMRNTLGNYREIMALDEQKHRKTASSIKFTPTTTQNKKCTFFKKAACISTKDKQLSNCDIATSNANENLVDLDNVQNAFKFNFQIKE